MGYAVRLFDGINRIAIATYHSISMFPPSEYLIVKIQNFISLFMVCKLSSTLS